MRCDDNGMALVSVVIMLTVLLLLSQVLVEKIWQSTRQQAAENQREQLFWAAQSGIESARQQLTGNYIVTDGWQTLLTASSARDYPADPAWSILVNGQSVDIFLRDNLDGDGDCQRDNDLKIYVLARARAPSGAEALVESLCGFNAAAGDAASPAPGQPVTGALADLLAQPGTTLDITD